MLEPPLRSHEKSERQRVPPRKRPKWWILLVLAAIFAAGTAVMAVSAARECESPEFRASLTAQLSRKLQADVSIAPLESRGLIFLKTPDVWIASQTGHWAVHLENVALELDLRSFFGPGWFVRSSQIRDLKVWLGSVPNEARNQAQISDFEPAVLQDSESDGVVSASISLPSIRAAQLTVLGPSYGERPPSFSVKSPATGSFQDGVLQWKLRRGNLQLGEGKPWKLDGIAGSLSAEGWKLDDGQVSSTDGQASIRISPVPASSPGRELVARVEASNIQLGRQLGIKNSGNLVKQVAIDAKGDFTARFPELHRFRFAGSFQLTGLEMSDWRMFRLIANQTGDNRFQGLKSDWANGEIEWTPGLVRLNQIVFEESELVRMQGRVSVVGSELVGVVEVALPAPVVGRFPGGKPSVFSYPAAGWSRAQVQLTGTLEDWREDLTQRLLNEIDPNVAVTANSTPVSPSTEKPPATIELSESHAEALETLFHRLLEN